jgi:hypothetical protein
MFARLERDMSRYRENRWTSVLLLAALLLRAGIPDGYMPSAVGSGQLFELCPAGVPPGFISALSGSGHHQHHDGSNASQAHYDTGQCPIGHLLSSTVTFDDLWQIDAIPDLPDVVATLILVHDSRVPPSHRSRGPPA